MTFLPVLLEASCLDLILASNTESLYSKIVVAVAESFREPAKRNDIQCTTTYLIQLDFGIVGSNGYSDNRKCDTKHHGEYPDYSTLGSFFGTIH